MKKIVCFLISAVLLAAMLSVFAVPAFAASSSLSIISGRTRELSGTESYGSVTNTGTLTVKAGANLTIDALTNNAAGKMVIEAGATVTVKSFSNKGAGAVTVYGVLRSGETPAGSADGGQLAVDVQPGGLFDLTFEKENYANNFAASIPGATLLDKNRVYVHTHVYNDANKCKTCDIFYCDAEGHTYVDGKCTVCNYVCQNKSHEGYCPECNKVLTQTEDEPIDGDTGSVLSEGNLTVIVGVACLAVGFLIAMFIFKKKKNTADE